MSEILDVIIDDDIISDLELLCDGSFSPCNEFMCQSDYISVLENMTLKNGEIFPIPIVLPINQETYSLVNKYKYCRLRDKSNYILSIGEILDVYEYNPIYECEKVYGTTDKNHPYVNLIMNRYLDCKYYMGYRITNNYIKKILYNNYRLTPIETKNFFKKNGWNEVIGFQTRNPLHKSHFNILLNSLNSIPNSKLFLNPVIGNTQDCDINVNIRVKCYKELVKYFPENSVLLNFLNLRMRMGGPREALLHAIIRKNYGCNYFIVGRDHAGPSSKKMDGSSFYNEYDAINLLKKYSEKIDIKIIMAYEMVYAIDLKTNIGNYYLLNNINNTNDYIIKNISGSKLRNMLENGENIPEWYSFPNIIEILSKYYIEKKNRCGLCVYFVGLSGSGKSTLANKLIEKFGEITNKYISLLDGDIVRNHLSKGLGFSKEDRSLNVRRIGFVASEIVKHGGIVFVANIAPYKNDRLYNRNLISKHGNYFQIYVNTNIEICKNRDTKGLYKLAKEGKLSNLTGVNDTFECPINDSDLVVDGNFDIDKIINDIFNFVLYKNYIF